MRSNPGSHIILNRNPLTVTLRVSEEIDVKENENSIRQSKNYSYMMVTISRIH